MTQQFKDMKFRVANEQESKMLQEKLFEMGHVWLGSGMPKLCELDAKFVFAGEDGIISTCRNHELYFTEHCYPEHKIIYSIVDLVPVEPETVEINGKTYAYSDIKRAIDGIKPIA